MMGLMILGALAVYLLASIWVTSKTANWAKANNRKPWLWGGLAAFVMYNLVFWDLIPTLVMHKYYCATQAGFWVYKTPEQWRAENPSMKEGLSSENKVPLDYKEEKIINGVMTAISLNKKTKIMLVTTITSLAPLLNSWKREAMLIDTSKNFKLTKNISFMAGRSSGAPKVWSDYRFWVNHTECDGLNGNVSRKQMAIVNTIYANLGESND